MIRVHESEHRFTGARRGHGEPVRQVSLLDGRLLTGHDVPGAGDLHSRPRGADREARPAVRLQEGER